MKAARLHRIGDFRVDDIELPEITGNEILIKVGACGVCGSDIPRIYELGTSKQRYPLTLGHEFSGEIVKVANKSDKLLIGKRGAVFPCIPCRSCSSCLTGNYAMCTGYDYLGSRSDGGFAEYCKIPSRWHFVESVNPETSLEALSMVEPVTVAQHAIRKSKLTAGNTIVIFGAGPIGIMAGRWAEIFGAGLVIMVDIADEKIAFSSERGLFTLNSLKIDIAEEIKAKNNGSLADVVIEGTGTGSALSEAIKAAKPFGTIALLGNPHKDTTIPLAMHSSILRKELNLVGVWNSHYCDDPINEWKYTVKMLDEGKLMVEDLITNRCNLEELSQLCKDIHDHKISICKALYSNKDDYDK